jgi:hypothetical protein
MKLADYNHIAFSGSRQGCPQSILDKVAAKIQPDTTILVGCARGVDAQVRAMYPDAVIFRAGQHGGNSYAEKLAFRSAAMVRGVYELRGCLVAFPMKSCPSMVKPCTEWRFAGGSGTWGTIALAAGLGVPTIIWLPLGIAAPFWWDDRVTQVSSGWFLVLPF